MSGFATKQDFTQLTDALNAGLAEMRLEITGLRGEMRTGLTEMRGEMRTSLTEMRGEMRTGFAEVRGEMASIKGELEVKIANTDVKILEVKTDLQRWVLAIFITTMLAILGLYFKK